MMNTKKLFSAIITLLISTTLFAQGYTYKSSTSDDAFKSEDVPILPYQFEDGYLKLPAGIAFGEVCSIDMDSRRHIYVFNRGTDHLIEFDPNGNYVQTLVKGYLDAPHGLRIDSYDNIWIVDSGSHIVLKLDREGHVHMVLGRKGFADSTDTFFYAPTDVAFGPNGEIFVSDGYGNSRIMKYDKDGNFIKTWGKAGNGPSEFKTPHTLIVLNDLLYVGDRDNLRMQIFDLDGNHKATWTHIGAPWGLDLTSDGNIIMADGYAERVVKFTPDGKVLGAFGTKGRSKGHFSFAHGIAISKDNEIYVTEILSWRVQKLIPKK